MKMTDLDFPNDDGVKLGELSNSLGLYLRLAQVKVFKGFYDAFSNEGMKPGEFTVLRLIGMNPGLRQGLIARTLMIKPAHMTKLVQRLVEAGFVERTIPPDDRRAVSLSLTPEGREFVDVHEEPLQAFERKGRRGLSDEEFDQFLGLLHKFVGRRSSR